MQQDYAAQAPQDNAPDAVLPAVAPSGANTGAPPAISQSERNFRAQAGREVAEARRQAAEANARAEHAVRTVDQIAREKYEQDKANWDAYLGSLPPEQRAVAELRADNEENKRQLAQMQAERQQAQQQPQRRQAPAQMTQQDIDARKQEIISQVSQRTGIQLTGREAGLDDSKGEAAFEASANAIAAQAVEYRRVQGQTIAPGAGQPLGVRPMAGGANRITTEQIEESMWRKIPPWERKKNLRDMRDVAKRQAGVD